MRQRIDMLFTLDVNKHEYDCCLSRGRDVSYKVLFTIPFDGLVMGMTGKVVDEDFFLDFINNK